MNPKLILLKGALVGILAYVLFLGAADTAHAGTFNPTLKVTVADTRPSAASDFTGDFNVPDGDVNFAGVVSFIPNGWTITPGGDIPIGTRLGTLTATATLGLVNGACNTVLPVRFEMLNGSIDVTDTVPFEDTEPEPGEPGYDPQNRGNNVNDFAEDRDGNGLQDAIDKYPEFITRVLDDKPGINEVGNPLQPIRRSAGITIVAGINVLLQYLVFEPGTFINENIPYDEELGYPTVTLLQNIGDPDVEPVPSTITDFCTPLASSNETLGSGGACDSVANDDDDDDEVVNDGCPAVGTAESAAEPTEGDDPCTNNVDDDLGDDLQVGEITVNDGCPQAGGTSEGDITHVFYRNAAEPGTYTFTTVAVGQRDADGDGYENGLDTCPFDANQGDPAERGDGDFDEDGIDDVCDPDPQTGVIDFDLDGYPNRQDNCPLIANGENEDNQASADLDQIGDACDPNPDDADAQGELKKAVLEQEITIAGEPVDVPTASPSADDGGGDNTTLIIIIAAVVAGVVVVGGGAFYFMRRGGA